MFINLKEGIPSWSLC